MEAIHLNYDLYKFIDGLYPNLMATITTNNEVKLNLEYQTWLYQDNSSLEPWLVLSHLCSFPSLLNPKPPLRHDKPWPIHMPDHPMATSNK